MRRAYRLAQALSLDVALGGLASGCLAAYHFGVNMPLAWFWVLPAAIWVMYTSDHLLDAWRLKATANTYRHQVHVQYFGPLAGLTAGVALLTLGLALAFLGRPVVLFGLGVACVSGLHFLLVALTAGKIRGWHTKELAVGAIFTAGVWGPPWVMAGMPVAGLGAVFQFFGLAMVNLLVFALYEKEADAAAGHPNLALSWGVRTVQRLAAAIALGIGAGIVASPFQPVQWIFGAMLAGLMWVAVDTRRFEADNRYRALGDAVFLFPYLILLWP